METTETQENCEVTLNPDSTRQKWFRRAIIVGAVLTGAGLVQFFAGRALSDTERFAQRGQSCFGPDQH